MRSALLPSGVTYRYVFSSPFDDEKPYLLFLHGFPETSYGWHFQIDYFRRQGYGVIAPDLLGYGGSDNPDDLMSFNFRRMASDLDQLLEYEKVDKVIGIGRDLCVNNDCTRHIQSSTNTQPAVRHSFLVSSTTTRPASLQSPF